MDSDSPKKSEIGDLTADSWRIIARSLNMESLLQLFFVGSKRLSSTLQRTYFEHLTCSCLAKKVFDGNTVAHFRSKMGLFAQLHVQSLTLPRTYLKPACLYVAAQAVSSEESRSNIKFDLDEAALEQIPWIRNWKQTAKVTLVRGEENDVSSKSDFATLGLLSLFVGETTPPLRNFSLYTGDRAQPVEMDRYLDEATCATKPHSHGDEDDGDEVNDDEASENEGADKEEHEGTGTRTITFRLATEFGEPENIFNFPSETLLAGLPQLSELHLYPEYDPTKTEEVPPTLLGEWKLDFTSLPNLQKFKLGFRSGMDSPERTDIVIKAGPNLTALSLLNCEGYGGFSLDTTCVPNLVSLELGEIFWSYYWQAHAEYHSATLESVTLSGAYLGTSAWTCQWPPNLTHLHLESPFIYPRHDDDRFEDRIASTLLNPNLLPTGLLSLVVNPISADYPFYPTLDRGDFDKEAEAAGEEELVDYAEFVEMLIDNDFSDVPIAARMILAPSLISLDGLPCKNLQSLVMNDEAWLTSFDMLPQSLRTIDCSLGINFMAESGRSLHVVFPEIQWNGLPSFRHLRRVNLSAAWWNHIEPLKEATSFLASSLTAQEAAHGPERSIDLIDWSLYSMMIALGGKTSPTEWNSLTHKVKAEIVEKLWITANKHVFCEVSHWFMAPEFPSEISAFIVSPKLDSAYGLQQCANVGETMQTEEIAPLPSVVQFTPIDNSKLASTQDEQTSQDDAPSLPRSSSGAPSVLHIFDLDAFEWSCLNNVISRLEMRSISAQAIADMSSLRLPNLQYLFISEQESIDPLAVKQIRLDTWISPLRELVVLTYGDRIRWPTRFLFPKLERVVTTNALSDLGVADFLDGAPLLRVLVSLNLGAFPIPPEGSPLEQWLSNDAQMDQNIPEQVATLVLDGETIKQTLVSFRKVRNRARPRP